MSTDAGGEGVPRDPSEYHLSIHAGQQRVHRDIPKPAIADTISTGEVETAAGDHHRKFIKQYPGDDYAIAVVVDLSDGEICTIEKHARSPR